MTKIYPPAFLPHRLSTHCQRHITQRFRLTTAKCLLHSMYQSWKYNVLNSTCTWILFFLFLLYSSDSVISEKHCRIDLKPTDGFATSNDAIMLRSKLRRGDNLWSSFPLMFIFKGYRESLNVGETSLAQTPYVHSNSVAS